MEKAFTLNHDCELYKEFFEAGVEKQHSHQLAREFFKKYELMGEDGQYIFSERLIVSLSDELAETYQKQLLSYKTEGLYGFKTNSKLNKAWKSEVIENVDMKKVNSCRFWYLDCIRGRGSYSLWPANEEVYGYLNSPTGEITLPDGAVEIKMSQYYAVAESQNEG